MPYNPSSDFVGLWRAISGGVEKGEMPGLDFVVQAMARAGLLRVVTSQTAPTVNQSTTAWFRPLPSSFSGEGSLFLWDPTLNMYVPATPELFHGGSTGTGGDGGGDGGAGGGPVVTTTMTFAIAQSTDLTGLSTTTWSIVPLTAQPQIDTMNGYDPVTHKYTPKTAGYYAFNARGWPDVTNWGGIAILKNDDGVFDNLSADTVIALSVLSGPSGAIQATTGFSQMNGTTDYVRFFMAALPSGVATSVGSNPCFSALLLP